MPESTPDFDALSRDIPDWARESGFAACGIAPLDLGEAGERLEGWLARGFHGDMEYMRRHGASRYRPGQLEPGTVSVISVRMDYLRAEVGEASEPLEDSRRAFISRYALGRDYHKLMRRRLARLAERIASVAGPFGYRAFCDSAPVMEKPLAALAGLGWIGKHTNLLCREAGSYFFLGELYTDLPLTPGSPVTDHCGDCTACLDACPTGAIVAPYQLDARLCISYLTIESRGPIPEALRPLLGNRVFGCDDCQLVCPWNRFARRSEIDDFDPRHGLDTATLLELFAWSEEDFERRTRGSALRRVGFEGWLRNLAVALGNAAPAPAIEAGLQARRQHPSALVREHVGWALDRQRGLQSRST